VAGGITAALASAVLFGGTFLGVTTLALAAGTDLRFPRAVALLTTGYSVGQIAGLVRMMLPAAAETTTRRMNLMTSDITRMLRLARKGFRGGAQGLWG